MTRRIVLTSMVLAGATLTWAYNRPDGSQATGPAPVPAACRVALASGPQKDDIDRDIARAQDEARNDVYARRALERLGYLYVSRARVTNDPGDYTLAEAAAECLNTRYPEEATALLLRGHVLHQLHRFREAEQLARTLIATRDYVLDYGLLGDALMEQGRLAEAAEAYQRMVDLKPFYQSYTRAAHMRWLRGDLNGAIAIMRLAIDAASPRDAESSAWAWTRLSAYELQAGRLDEAAAAVDAALGHQRDYAPALLGQGRILLARNRGSEATAVLRRAAQRNPLPEYQWLLADALRLQRLDAEAAAVEQEITTRGAAADPRTVALYLATRGVEPARAAALADEELRIRGDIFTLDAQAWALVANGRIDQAGEVMECALAAGTSDGRLFLHAGVIHARAGRRAVAARWLERAYELRATLLPSESALLAKYLNGTERKGDL